MKKIKLLLATVCILAFTVSSAMALQFSLDLSTLGANYGTYTDIFRINVDGYANVNQSFGTDGVFNDGDAFTEMTLLQQISYKHSLSGSTQYFTGLNTDGKIMFLYADGLQGTAYNVEGSGTNTTFDYTYTPGVGSIGIYLDDDTGTLTAPSSSAELVASFSLYSGDGAGADGFLGGLENAGTTRLTGEFLPVTPDGVWAAAGLDLGNLPSGYTAFASLNTTNQVVGPVVDSSGQGSPEYYGHIDNAGNWIADGFIADINSTGHMTVNVVPEPATLALLGLGLLGLAGITRRKIG